MIYTEEGAEDGGTGKDDEKLHIWGWDDGSICISIPKKDEDKTLYNISDQEYLEDHPELIKRILKEIKIYFAQLNNSDDPI